MIRAEIRFRAGSTPHDLLIVHHHDGQRRVLATGQLDTEYPLRRVDDELAGLGWRRVGDWHCLGWPWWCAVEKVGG